VVGASFFVCDLPFIDGRIASVAMMVAAERSSGPSGPLPFRFWHIAAQGQCAGMSATGES
jgi:hypothetical protein